MASGGLAGEAGGIRISDNHNQLVGYAARSNHGADWIVKTNTRAAGRYKDRLKVIPVSMYLNNGGQPLRTPAVGPNPLTM